LLKVLTKVFLPTTPPPASRIDRCFYDSYLATPERAVSTVFKSHLVYALRITFREWFENLLVFAERFEVLGEVGGGLSNLRITIPGGGKFNRCV
jgi:hypothetical protein